MAEIHPTASVDPGARLGEGVRIGPFAVIASGVEIGDRAQVGPHAVVHPFVRIGRDSCIHAHAALGDLPQDVSFDGRETWLEIGEGTVIRENVTAHRATSTDRPTRIGAGCYLMAGSHVAHDCQVGDGVVMTNNVLLGGHVRVGEQANLGGAAVVHQFCRIGRLAMVGGFGGVGQDVLPYSMVHGIPAVHFRINTVGLRRAGVRGDRYRALEAAFRALRKGDRTLADAPETPEVAHLRRWLATQSKRGLCSWTAPRSRRGLDSSTAPGRGLR